MRKLMTLLAAGSILVASPLAAQQPPPRDPKPAAAAETAPSPEVAEYDALIAKARVQAALTPEDPAGYYRIAVATEDIARRGKALSREQKLGYIKQGLAAIDEALLRKPDYTEALVYKGLLLRQQALQTEDPEEQKALIASAAALRNRAIELNTARAGGPAPIPAPTDASTGCRLMPADGMAPVRVGGNIKAPTKTVDMRPVYPPEAQAARVSGVVILEVLIDVAGLVSQACVLRSIPILDDAAVDAVKQWQFTPTFLDGGPVPVVMTVTVNFTLQ
jgi:TonB family protein